MTEKPVGKTDNGRTNKQSKLEARHAEILSQLQSTIRPLPDSASLAQPSPFAVVPTFVTYSAYEDPIMAD